MLYDFEVVVETVVVSVLEGVVTILEDRDGPIVEVSMQSIPSERAQRSRGHVVSSKNQQAGSSPSGKHNPKDSSYAQNAQISCRTDSRQLFSSLA